MDEETLSLLEGIHFHTLCEQNADALRTTLDAVEARFGACPARMQWLNMGGGHHNHPAGFDLPLPGDVHPAAAQHSGA
jgi:carboxynorspermidine decarboxylase